MEQIYRISFSDNEPLKMQISNRWTGKKKILAARKFVRFFNFFPPLLISRANPKKKKICDAIRGQPICSYRISQEFPKGSTSQVLLLLPRIGGRREKDFYALFLSFSPLPPGNSWDKNSGRRTPSAWNILSISPGDPSATTFYCASLPSPRKGGISFASSFAELTNRTG